MIEALNPQRKRRQTMQISSRFTIAVHMLLCMEMFKDTHKVTSDFLASSVHANPVVMRKLLQQLKKAGLVRVTRGTGGAEAAKPLTDITLLDIYHAVECVETGALFHFHENPNPHCPVGRNIHAVLDGRLAAIQQAMENQLRSVTMQELFLDAQRLI